MLEEVLLPSKHTILILTKSDLVTRDYDIISEHENVHVGFTIIHLNDADNETYEPNGAPPSRRGEAVKQARERGIKTFVSIEPWIPEWTNPLEIIEATGADRYIIGSYQKYGSMKPDIAQDTLAETYRRKLPGVIRHLAENGIPYFIKHQLNKQVNFEW